MSALRTRSTPRKIKLPRHYLHPIRNFFAISRLGGGEPVGFAMWFVNFSTFRGRHGLYLEDLFVRPAFRGKGIGKALMRHLARRCVEENFARFEWTVLDWNTPSIEFYKSIGAKLLDDWRVCRMTDEALAGFAREGAR